MKTRLIFMIALTACATAPRVSRPPMASVPGPERVISGTGLRYVEVREGDGPVAERGLCAYMHYTLYRRNGEWLESSRDAVAGKSADPLPFAIGAGTVIRGWDTGVTGMRTGGVRRLFVPEEMGYGAAGAPPLIPPRAFLVFDIELMMLAESVGKECVPWGRIHGRG